MLTLNAILNLGLEMKAHLCQSSVANMCHQFSYTKHEESQSPSSTCHIASFPLHSCQASKNLFSKVWGKAGKKGNCRKGKQNCEGFNLKIWTYCTALQPSTS